MVIFLSRRSTWERSSAKSAWVAKRRFLAVGQLGDLLAQLAVHLLEFRAGPFQFGV